MLSRELFPLGENIMRYDLANTHIALNIHLPTTGGKMVHLRYCNIPTPG